jgi:hypothetical protein
MTRRLLWPLLLLFLAIAAASCASPPGKDMPLSGVSTAGVSIGMEIDTHSPQFGVHVTVPLGALGTRPYRGAFEQTPDSCPRIHATAEVNGASMDADATGGWDESRHMCNDAGFVVRQIPSSPNLVVTIADESARWTIKVDDFLRDPYLSWDSPADGAMQVGSSATIRWQPSDLLNVANASLGDGEASVPMRLCYGASPGGCEGFSLCVGEFCTNGASAGTTAAGLSFVVPAISSPSAGFVTLQIEGLRDADGLGSGTGLEYDVRTCDGPAHCRAGRMLHMPLAVSVPASLLAR